MTIYTWPLINGDNNLDAFSINWGVRVITKWITQFIEKVKLKVLIQNVWFKKCVNFYTFYDNNIWTCSMFFLFKYHSISNRFIYIEKLEITENSLKNKILYFTVWKIFLKNINKLLQINIAKQLSGFSELRDVPIKLLENFSILLIIRDIDICKETI